MGVKTRTYHNLLDKNNEFSAYLFGFWLADGNISLCHVGKRRVKSFALYNTDRDLMYQFGQMFKKEPYYVRSKKSTKNCYVLMMKSDQLFDKCYALTSSTSKSNKSIPLPNVSNKLFHHFVRGFFDGDGSIHIKHYKTRHGKLTSALQSNFTAGNGTGDFLERLRDKLREFIPVGYKKVSQGTSKHLQFNQYDTMLLCEWMYRDATWYMKRKKDIWDNYDKEKLRNSVKYFSNKV